MRAVSFDVKSVTTPTSAAAKAWATHFGCSIAEPKIAIRAVGPSTERVRAYLSALRGLP